jgi:hypothetical protein
MYHLFYQSVPTVQEAGCAPEPVWTQARGKIQSLPNSACSILVTRVNYSALLEFQFFDILMCFALPYCMCVVSRAGISFGSRKVENCEQFEAQNLLKCTAVFSI